MTPTTTLKVKPAAPPLLAKNVTNWRVRQAMLCDLRHDWPSGCEHQAITLGVSAPDINIICAASMPWCCGTIIIGGFLPDLAGPWERFLVNYRWVRELQAKYPTAPTPNDAIATAVREAVQCFAVQALRAKFGSFVGITNPRQSAAAAALESLGVKSVGFTNPNTSNPLLLHHVDLGEVVNTPFEEMINAKRQQ